MGFAGRLEGIAPSDIFQIISQSRMTGTLIARCPDGTAMIVFKDGQVTEAASDEPRESLGHLLVAQGLMSKETIEAAQERRRQAPDRPLGAILVEMGAISEQTLETIMLRQIGHIVQRLVSCEDGFITFDRGEMAVKRKLNTHEFFAPSGVSAEYLMMERVRAMDEKNKAAFGQPAPTVVLPPVSEPAKAAFRAVMEEKMSGAAAGVQRLFTWSRGTMLPKAAAMSTSAWFAVRSGLRKAGIAVRRGKDLAVSAAGRFRSSALPKIRTAVEKVRALSPDGTGWIIAGAGGIVAGTALILATTLSFERDRHVLEVTGNVVNVRANPSTKSMVIAQVEQGDTMLYYSSVKGWHKVRTRKGKTGWIWQTLAEHKEEKGLSVSYHVKGFELLLIAGIAALVVGILRKRKAGPGQPEVLKAAR